MFTTTRLPVVRGSSLYRHILMTIYLTRVHVSTRTGAGLLRSMRRELMTQIVAAAAFLLTSDFFSMCMTLLLVEDVSPTALTH